MTPILHIWGAVHTRVCAHTCGHQRTAEVSVFFPPCVSQGLNRPCQPWQTPSSAQSSCWPLNFCRSCFPFLFFFLTSLLPSSLPPSLPPFSLSPPLSVFPSFLLVFLIGNFYFFRVNYVAIEFASCQNQGALPVPL